MLPWKTHNTSRSRSQSPVPSLSSTSSPGRKQGRGLKGSSNGGSPQQNQAQPRIGSTNSSSLAVPDLRHGRLGSKTAASSAGPAIGAPVTSSASVPVPGQPAIGAPVMSSASGPLILSPSEFDAMGDDAPAAFISENPGSFVIPEAAEAVMTRTTSCPATPSGLGSPRCLTKDMLIDPTGIRLPPGWKCPGPAKDSAASARLPPGAMPRRTQSLNSARKDADEVLQMIPQQLEENHTLLLQMDERLTNQLEQLAERLASVQTCVEAGGAGHRLGRTGSCNVANSTSFCPAGTNGSGSGSLSPGVGGVPLIGKPVGMHVSDALFNELRGQRTPTNGSLPIPSRQNSNLEELTADQAIGGSSSSNALSRFRRPSTVSSNSIVNLNRRLSNFGALGLPGMLNAGGAAIGSSSRRNSIASSQQGSALRRPSVAASSSNGSVLAGTFGSPAHHSLPRRSTEELASQGRPSADSGMFLQDASRRNLRPPDQSGTSKDPLPSPNGSSRRPSAISSNNGVFDQFNAGTVEEGEAAEQPAERTQPAPTNAGPALHLTQGSSLSDSSDSETELETAKMARKGSSSPKPTPRGESSQRLKAQWSLAPHNMENALAELERMDSKTSMRDLASFQKRGSAATRASLFLREEDQQRGRCIFMPGDPLRLAWDALVVLLTTLTMGLAPLAMIYFEEAEANGDAVVKQANIDRMTEASMAVLNIADILWISDIILNLRTGFVLRGNLVTKPKSIMLAYAKGWLIFDLVTAWPFFLTPRSSHWALLVLKLIRVVRLVEILDRLQKELRWSALLPAKVFLLTVLPTHLLACAWRLAARADIRGAAASGGDVEEPLLRWWDVYIEDAYWVMMTLTTVGYGDVSPSGNIGKGLAILTMTLAPFFNGAIVSILTHVSRGFFNDHVSQQVSEAARFMRKRNIPRDLQRRVEHNLRTQLRQENNFGLAPALLTKLSPSMQRELTLELLSNTVLNFPLFCSAPVAFIAEIAQAHSWVMCGAGDLVVEAGQLEQEVVFLVLGRLLVVKGGVDSTSHEFMATAFSTGPEDSHGCRRAVESELQPGAWLGEASLFEAESVRAATVFARSDSELAVLQASEYHRIVKKYPQLMMRHASLVQDIEGGKLKLDDLAWYPAEVKAGRGQKLFGRMFRRKSFDRQASLGQDYWSCANFASSGGGPVSAFASLSDPVDGAMPPGMVLDPVMPVS